MFWCQFVVLDECSQMTEPSSLLAIARFHCERLVLLGDPKVDHTITPSAVISVIFVCVYSYAHFAQFSFTFSC